MFDPGVPLIRSILSLFHVVTHRYCCGDCTAGLRPAWMEMADSNLLDRGSDQLFLASGFDVKLGAGPFFREQHGMPGWLYLAGYWLLCPW